MLRRPIEDNECYLGVGDKRPSARRPASAVGLILLGGILFAGIESFGAEKQADLYVRVEDAFTQDVLTLREDGSYEMSTVSEGPRPSYRGTYKRQGDVLTLGGAAGRAPGQLLQVDWGTRRYLVEPSRLKTLCVFLRSVRRDSVPNEMIFYRTMDQGAAVPKEQPKACR